MCDPVGMPHAAQAAIYADGPWTHREVSANGIRQHVVEAGTGPLVLLLHGFPEFWWAWRHQLVALADAGLHPVAVDLRGYGGSDKPPRGYDAFTLSGDIAGLVRALGESEAMLVGHDWGGVLAWSTATLHPRVVRRIAVISAPHPLRLRQALFTDPRGQLAASRHAFGFQAPKLPESLLTRDDAADVANMFYRWAGPQWTHTLDFTKAVRTYRDAMQIPTVAHCALEYYRWMMRSQLRPDGWRYRRLMSEPVSVPTLQLHGSQDTCILPRSAQGSGRYVAATYEWRILDDAGHFPAEETPERVNGELVRWAKGN
jgi:pimeloyl-ACP methyl ester carboxylesterase